MEKKIYGTFDRETAAQLKAGDCVYLTGTIYTAARRSLIRECRKRWTEERSFPLTSAEI